LSFIPPAPSPLPPPPGPYNPQWVLIAGTAAGAPDPMNGTILAPAPSLRAPEKAVWAQGKQWQPPQQPPPVLITVNTTIRIGNDNVTVQQVDTTVNPPRIYADFKNSPQPSPTNPPGGYPIGTAVNLIPPAGAIASTFGTGSILGNPGPQPNFDHRANTLVVPFYSIIDN